MQPTDPQYDIKGTGNFELWNRQVNLIKPLPVQEATDDSEQYDTPSQPLRAGNWLTKVTLPKFQNLPEVTCVYGIDGKCSGTITPQCLSILQDAYNSARHRGAHTLMNLPVQDLATKIQGLVVIGRLYGAETFALPAELPYYLQPALPRLLHRLP